MIDFTALFQAAGGEGGGAGGNGVSGVSVGGNGGSGIVIIRYPTIYKDAASTTN